jgi:hypothetical protein
MSSGLRQFVVPLEHVRAELLAFPLASEASFRAALTHLDPAPASHPTKLLWQAFEREVFHTLPSVSVDEIACLRDQVWHGVSSSGNLDAYLRHHAGGLLRRAGDVAEPRPADDGAAAEVYCPADCDDEAMVAARRRWRWVSFALPPDLLLAALPCEHPPARVEPLSPLLRNRLADGGYAEAHVHLGAAIDFAHLWASLQFTLAQPDCRPDRFVSSGTVFEHGSRFGDWLLRVAIARCVLAAYLVTGNQRHEALGTYLHREIGPRIHERNGATAERAFRIALNELHDGHFADESPPWHWLWRLYRNLYDALTTDTAELEVLGRIDPVGGLTGWQEGNPELPDGWLLRTGLTQLAQRPDDAGFARLFWQMVRVRCLFYRHVVQRPMTPGLHWFLRFYGRIAHGRSWFDQEGGRTVASAFRLQGQGAGLRSLEVRTGPGSSWHEMAAYLRQVDGAAHGRGVEFGMVLHFIKDRGDQTAGGFPAPYGAASHADPGRTTADRPDANPTGLRYAEFYRSRRRQADAWVELLQRCPDTIRLVRGVDICSDERAIPNWVLSDPYLRVATAGEMASARLRDGTPPPRKTIHVGEDFVHPLSGLRLVAEAVRFLGLRGGDRLGHALALGLDLADWCSRAGRVAQRREERLFDLTWEWHWCTRRRSPKPNRLPFLESEIRRLAREVFSKSLEPTRISDLIVDLHTPGKLRAVGFPDGVCEPELADPLRDELLRDYLASGAVFRRGQTTEWVSVQEEGTLLAALQAEVRAEVGRRGIVVEVNPSSNWLIGDFGDLHRHPFWRLAGPPGIQIDAPPLAICLGSDDPLIFATDIRQEYQHVFDALISAGNSAEVALRWVDTLRDGGLAARFTLAHLR